jgi:hypothetical protein
MAPDCKSGARKRYAGSNPALPRFLVRPYYRPLLIKESENLIFVRKHLGILTTAAAVTAVALLAACSGSGSPANTSVLPGSGMSQSHSLSDPARSGVAPNFLGLLHAHPASVRPAHGKADLNVDDFNNNAVEELVNNSWNNIGSITNGINGPDGNFFANHQLYVANYAADDITEYSSATNETFAYNAGMTDPVDVAVDKHGNVFEADYNYPTFTGFINEYAQQSNTVAATCSPGGAVEGVAVDKHGNVFADYNITSGSITTGYIVEYTGGLTGCNATVLPITLKFAGGMVFDKHGNLVVCDQEGPVVDVIAAPYTSVTGTLGSGYTDPFHVTINKKNKQAYVTDLAAAVVDVLDYPSGTNVATLGSANGLSDPSSAVDGDNYVP